MAIYQLSPPVRPRSTVASRRRAAPTHLPVGLHRSPGGPSAAGRACERVGLSIVGFQSAPETRFLPEGRREARRPCGRASRGLASRLTPLGYPRPIRSGPKSPLLRANSGMDRWLVIQEEVAVADG